MPRCCGEERGTPFCPLCGKLLCKHTPLDGLLSYLDSHAKNHEKRLQAYKDDIASGNEPDFRKVLLPKWIRQVEALVAKWRGWHDALKRLLDPDTPPEQSP